MHVSEITGKDADPLRAEIKELSGKLYKSMACTKAILRNIDNVGGVKQALKYDDETTAQELWEEIDTNDQCDLMIAPSKGGAFTTKERAIVTSFWRITVADYEASLK